MGTTVTAWAAVVCLLTAGMTGAVVVETVPVGSINNPGELSGLGAGGIGEDRVCGSVGYVYSIGKYEVTAGQFCEFLNAVAKADTYGLYNIKMATIQDGSGITRSGSSGSYTYSVDPAFVNRPVNYLSFGDACRFANWLHNGQPTGPQNLATTEDGAYYLNGATSNAALMAVTRKAGWQWAVTSEDEWYKAAYYDPGTGSYYDYPTRSNDPPGRLLSDIFGNNANYYGYPSPLTPPYYTTVVGQFRNSASPYGTFDQGGNLSEWNETVVSGSYRGLRGGSIVDYANIMRAANRYSSTPTYEGFTLGFRVVWAGIIGDVNGDGHVDVSDLLLLAGSFGLCAGQGGYDPRCDLDGDDCVDAADVLVLAGNWGT